MIAPKTAAVTADADTALRHKVLRRIKNRPTTRGAVVLLGILLLLALLAPFIAPQDPHDLASLSVMDNRLEPGAQGMTGITYWLGTDALGRDILSRLIFGARTALLGPLLVVVLSTVLGALLGLVAGWRGGWLDAALARHRLDRVARHQPDQQEGHQRHPDEGRDDQAEPGKKETQQGR